MGRRLAWWAERQFRLNRPQKEGGTLREQFAAYRRMAKRRHPEDRGEEPPPQAVAYLFVWYQEIARGRPVSAMGHYMPIPSSEILAWCSLSGTRLEQWELDAIRRIDSAFLQVMGEKD